ncbi:MAG: putative Ig domain-containing protein, partial [bacterium]
SVVLSGFSRVCGEVKLTPLLIAELKAQGLGEADVFRCLLVDDVDVPVPVARNAFTFSGDTKGVTMPVFNYGPKDNVKKTAIDERKLIRVIQMSPMYHPVDNSPETLAEIERLTQANKYDVYLYELPDGSIYTYQPSVETTAVVETITVGDFTVDLTYAFSAEQKTAIQFTLQLWSDQLSTGVPIRFELGFASLSGGTLAQASTSFLATGGKLYPYSVYNHMVGYDVYPSDPDFTITFNSNYLFSYGTTGSCPAGYTDFVSVFLHEVTHGLGFVAAINSDGSYLLPGYPSKWAEYLYYNGSTLNTLTDSGRSTAIRSTALYWDGPNAKAANSNIQIKMYAPSTYNPGSSVSHWDTGVSFTTFMKYAIATGTYCRTINARETMLLKDIGWRTMVVTLGLSGSPMLEAGGVATVTATLSGACSLPVTVSLSFSGTATQTTDYTPSGTSISIPAGSLSGSITLTAVQDTSSEGDESIVVDISSVSSGTESGVQQVTATISDDDYAPTITTSSPLPSGTVNDAYSQTLTATGGTTPYTWTNSTGSLPSGLRLNSAGVISGTPSVATNASFTVKVNGGDGNSSTKPFSLSIIPPPHWMLNVTLSGSSGS